MIVKILLVDDAPDKVTRIKSSITDFIEPERFEIVEAHSVFDAIRKLRDNHYDLLILDLLLPARGGETAIDDGGLRVLRALKGPRSINVPDHIIGLTAYTDLEQKYSEEFSKDMWLIAEYDASTSLWETQIRSRIEHIIASNESTERSEYDYDIAIITALHNVELESVLALDADWTEHTVNGDASIYHLGSFKRGDICLRVVAASAVEMGMCAATSLSMKLSQHFKPKFIAMVGIAAGVKGNPGDVLIADQSWDYGSGKSRRSQSEEQEFLPAPNAIPLDSALKHKLHWFKLRVPTLHHIQAQWTGEAPTYALEASMGPIGSGAAVLEDRRIIDQILSHNRKLIGVEMEIYGVFHAAINCIDPKPKAMAFKSICDLADSRKSDDFQKYAAFTSANFLYEFALEMLN